MIRRLDVAVVGARGVGATHVAALRATPCVRVALVVGSSADTAAAAARRLDVPSWSADWKEAVADDSIGAVHVCTPNDLHLPIAAAALANGKHVVCEKPLALDATEATELAELARAHSGRLAVLGYKYRYCRLVQRLCRQVREGRLGRVHDIRASYLQGWMLSAAASWRSDPSRGGDKRVALDIGTHLLDLMETVLGQRLVAMQGQLFSMSDGGTAVPAANDDGAHLLLRFDRGTRGVASLSQVSPAHDQTLTLEVDGSAATARWTLGHRETLTVIAADPDDRDTTSGRQWSAPSEPDALLVPLFDHAYNGAGESYVTPPPSFEDGLRHIALIDAL